MQLLPLLALATLLHPGGAPGAAAFDLESCRMEVTLAPASHSLAGTAELTLLAPDAGTDVVRLELHRGLALEEVSRDGEPLAWRQEESAVEPGAAENAGEAAAGGTEEDSREASIYEIPWPPELRRATLTLRYAGTLVEDVQAGERPGEIHNFEVRAHVGPEGIYLSDEVPWYPRPARSGEDTDLDLARFEVTARAPGMLLVASGDREGARAGAPRGESSTWRSPFPLPGVALVGGPHQAYQRQVGPVLVSVHLLPDSAPFADGLLDAAEHYLMLYPPLLGPYPYTELTVVENFFSSGFAMPGFTVLASAVIGLGERGLRPGYLDHELLHNWWGNGVFVSPGDGNWAEALASYSANYMRRVLEGRQDEARAQRRDITQSLSRVPPGDDRPLDAFGRDEEAGALIGYSKGSMVFAQLAQRLGEETVWRALRRFYLENRGSAAGWREIRAAFETESGTDLGPFFEFWVRGSGLPEIALTGAAYDPGEGLLTVSLERSGGDGLPLEVPLRLLGEAGESAERSVYLEGGAATASLPLDFVPEAVELDPDYRLLRRVPPGILMPTISGLRPGKPLIVVRADGDPAAYGEVAGRIAERWQGHGGGAVGTDEEEREEDDGAAGNGESEQLAAGRVREVAASQLVPDDLGAGHALLLGRAARTPAARELLAAGPVGLTPEGFTVEDTAFEEPDQAVLCCLASPTDPGAVLCFYLANGEEALGNAHLLTFYGGNSLLVFDGGTPVLRRDFDRAERVAVSAAP